LSLKHNISIDEELSYKSSINSSNDQPMDLSCKRLKTELW
jgi:hypothetical protein